MGREVEIGAVEQLPVEVCWLLRVPVETFQDRQEVTWHLICCTGTQLWRSTRSGRNYWVWVDSGTRSIYRALKDFYLAHLLLIIKVHELITGLFHRLVLVDSLYIENAGKLSNITGLVISTVGRASGQNRTTEIVAGIKRIMGMAHLEPETAEIDNKQW